MKISELVDDIQRDYPDPLESTIERAVRRAFLDFCKRSEAWRHRDGDALVIGENYYPLVVPQGTYVLATEFCRVTLANGDERTLTPVQWERVRLDGRGLPEVFCIEDKELAISPVGVEGEYVLEVKLAPKRSCTDIPEEMADKFLDVIRNGAIYELLRMPGQYWSENITRNQVADMQAEYEAGVMEAKREARKDRSRPSRVAQIGGYSVGTRRRTRSLF